MAPKNKPKIVGDRKWIRYLTVLVALLGFAISGYAYFVELKLADNKHYKPLCDINKEVRCSKALSSKYSRGFGFLGKVFGDKHTLNQPNTVFGMLFYTLMACLGFARNSKASLVQLNLSIISCLVSGYLGYVLFYVEKEICPVCISTYVINVIILLLSVFKGTPHVASVRESGASKKTDKVDAALAGKGPGGRPLAKPSPPKASPSAGPTYAQAVKQQGDAKKRRD